MTYLELNTVFLVATGAFLLVTTLLVRRDMPWRAIGVTLVVVLVLTAIFDNVIIGVGLVAYDPQLLSGLYIGLAPIEDFAYAVVAPIVVGCISALSTWRRRA